MLTKAALLRSAPLVRAKSSPTMVRDDAQLRFLIIIEGPVASGRLTSSSSLGFAVENHQLVGADIDHGIGLPVFIGELHQ